MKFFYSKLIHNGTHFLPAPSTIVCNDDGTIVDICIGKKLIQAVELSGLICPGFINAHCHLELSYLHNTIPLHTGLVNFVSQINTIRNQFSEQIILQKIADAELQMIANGIVAVGDISNTNYTIPQKKLQNIQYHTFVEVAGVLDAIAQVRYADAIDLQQQMNAVNRSTIVPHAPYSVSPQLFHLINHTANNSPISIHNQECLAENHLICDGNGEFIPFLKNITQQKFIASAHGISSLQYYLPMLQKLPSILFVHNTYTSSADVIFAQQLCAKPYWVLCPKANLFIENKLSSEFAFLSNTPSNICIGTDSLASNNRLCIFDEIKTLHNHSGAFTTEQLLQFATSNGAAALQMPQLGNITIGTKPGLVHIADWVQQQHIPATTQINRLL